MGFVVHDGITFPQFMGTRQTPTLVRDRQISCGKSVDDAKMRIAGLPVTLGLGLDN
jgi:hypothetical protein